MAAGLLRVVGLALLAGAGGCATQHGTSQALTVAGAAAVVIGASMAADEQCTDGPSEGALVYCAENASKGVRNTGKAIAVAGVGLAAAGYALKPKGPDNLQRVRPDPDAAPASPYRLIRRDPPPELPSEPTSEPPSEASRSTAGVPGESDGTEGDTSGPRPEPPSAAEPVQPGAPVAPPPPCASGGTAGAGTCPPDRAPTVAPAGGARRPPR